MNRHKSNGFTLLEAMIVVAIAGILAAVAVPSFQSMLETNSLNQVAESFKSDMEFARTRAISHSEDVVVSRETGNLGAWCYGLASAKSSCDCTETNTADADYCDIKIVLGDSFNSTNMDSASGNSSFDFRRGTIGANGVTFTSSYYAVRVVFSAVGRVRICTPDPLPSGKIGLPDKESC